MEKIKILIIADDLSKSNLTKYLSKILESLSLEGEFIYAEEYTDALNKLADGTYDIIALDDFILEQSTISLVDYIDGLHQKAISFFLASSREIMQKAQEEDGLTFCFFKSIDNNIYLYDLEKVKEALIATGKVSSAVWHKNLIVPISVFTQTYADSTPSEKESQKNCVEVAKVLNSKQIHYAITDPLGYYNAVYVSRDDVQVVKKIAEASNLEFWANWSKEYLKELP